MLQAGLYKEATTKKVRIHNKQGTWSKKISKRGEEKVESKTCRLITVSRKVRESKSCYPNLSQGFVGLPRGRTWGGPRC